MKDPDCPVSVVREEYYIEQTSSVVDYSVSQLLTNSPWETYGENYWLAPVGQKSVEFVLDLGCSKQVNMVELVNTHNGFRMNRGTKEFKVFVSESSEGPWELVVHQTLEDSRYQSDRLPLQTFPFHDLKVRFVKFNQISFHGDGGGLQYFGIKRGINKFQISK